MSTSVLRTADAWWVETPAGAARIATKAKTTAGWRGGRCIELTRRTSLPKLKVSGAGSGSPGSS